MRYSGGLERPGELELAQDSSSDAVGKHPTMRSGWKVGPAASAAELSCRDMASTAAAASLAAALVVLASTAACDARSHEPRGLEDRRL